MTFQAKPKLLAILHTGGATGEHFTSQQIVAYIGKYIEINKLYDPLNKRIIRCKNDLLGEVFQRDEFIVTKDAYKNLWKLVAPYLYIPSKKDGPPKEQIQHKEGESSSSQEPELPWWYFVNREKQDEAGNSQTTGHRSYDHRETVIVQDSDEEESVEDFYEEYEPVDIEEDSDATEPVSSDDDVYPSWEIESLTKFQSLDSSSDEATGTDFSIESDIAVEDYWSCQECRTKNRPTVGYCQRCWKLRRGWVQGHEPLTRSATDPVVSSSQAMELSRSTSVDVCDGSGKSGVGDNVAATSQSTITPQIPSFSSPLKHKLEENDSINPDQSVETEAKRMHLGDLDPPQTASPTSATTSTTNSSSDVVFIGLCNICSNFQNDSIIVHGRTGHQFCCYRCARRLQKKGKNCPVCREPIMLVIRNFVVQC